MSDEQKAKENEVFDQELSMGDLDATAGGGVPGMKELFGGDRDYNNLDNCTNHEKRPIYGGNGFPNCAATVEDGSWCKRNDACYGCAVDYRGRTECKKAWR
ncbi:MAG: hypothetical protein UHS51_03395 [Atopobiaceae bacterium]|nr:hypothetical protein [Atopobiaceae bacterium]